MTIMTFLAHPDDAEIACGGTLARYYADGHKICIAFACSGDKGNYTIPPAELAKMRANEATKAGAHVNAEIFHLDIGDAQLCYDQETLGLVVDTIRAADPDVIFTHTPEDYHLDHKTISRLVVDASFLTSVPGVRPQTTPSHKAPQIYFVEPYTGIGFLPTEYVDISETIHTKLAMMRCHESQITWMQEHDNTNILEYIQTTAKYRGFQCGVAHAEGFIRYITALRAAPGQFLPNGKV